MAEVPLVNSDAGTALVESSISHYLMKAEPDSRIVKGKDLKFSVEDFEAAQTTAWEGVRNYEARNIMQAMKVGDRVLFYHSNTKNPGIAGFAEVSKEAYPDHTAWDESHPYYDAKSDQSKPKWYMVDVRFVSRVSHFVPLSLLRHLSHLSEVPEDMPYLNSDDLKAIGNMALLNKGRLSVQRVDKGAWDALKKIAQEGVGGIGTEKVVRQRPRKRVSRQSPEEDKNYEKLTDDEAEGNTRAKGKRKAKGQADPTRKSKRGRVRQA